MNTELRIPEETITVELSLKEAMALTGVRFNQDTEVLALARRKLSKSLDRKLVPETEKIHFHTLEL